MHYIIEVSLMHYLLNVIHIIFMNDLIFNSIVCYYMDLDRDEK
jgi:hypothetical protein